MHRRFKCPARKYQGRKCKRCGHFSSLCFRRSESPKSRQPQVHQLQAGLIYTCEDSICGQSGVLTSSDESFCSQVQIQGTRASARFPTPHHLTTNLEYRLKPHHRSQFLRARLDTHKIKMKINDLDSVLNEIFSTQIEASTLIDHIHKPQKY